MQIKVNGKECKLATPMSVAALVEELQLKPTQTAIERNREIVSRSRYGEVMLSDGDEIEIVRFIGGG
jgi:thiamine biosynthesis protein ThiS